MFAGPAGHLGYRGGEFLDVGSSVVAGWFSRKIGGWSWSCWKVFGYWILLFAS